LSQSQRHDFFTDGYPEDPVFAVIRFIPKFERGHPERWHLNKTGVGMNWWFSVTRKSEMLQDRTNIAINH